MRSNDRIPLHPTRALDPHLTICPICGGKTNSLVIGYTRKAELPNGKTVYCTRGQERALRKSLVDSGVLHSYEFDQLEWKSLEENEQVPDSEPCKKCKEEIQKEQTVLAEAVAEGGVYFRCLQCKCRGVFTKESNIAVEVRKVSGKEAPEPIGIEFNNCEEHNNVPLSSNKH